MQKLITFDPVTHEVVGSITCTQWNAPRNSLKIEVLASKVGFAVIVNSDLTATKTTRFCLITR